MRPKERGSGLACGRLVPILAAVTLWTGLTLWTVPARAAGGGAETLGQVRLMQSRLLQGIYNVFAGCYLKEAEVQGTFKDDLEAFDRAAKELGAKIGAGSPDQVQVAKYLRRLTQRRREIEIRAERVLGLYNRTGLVEPEAGLALARSSNRVIYAVRQLLRHLVLGLETGTGKNTPTAQALLLMEMEGGLLRALEDIMAATINNDPFQRLGFWDDLADFDVNAAVYRLLGFPGPGEEDGFDRLLDLKHEVVLKGEALLLSTESTGRPDRQAAREMDYLAKAIFTAFDRLWETRSR